MVESVHSSCMPRAIGLHNGGVKQEEKDGMSEKRQEAFQRSGMTVQQERGFVVQLLKTS